jgi:hypothetical protein
MMMKVAAAAVLVSIVLCIEALGAELFPRGVYWPQERVAWLAAKAGQDAWTYSDRLLAELHDRQHCNLIWVVNIGTDDLKRLAAAGAAHGVAVAGTPEVVYWWRQHRTSEFAVRTAREIADRLSRAEGLCAYVLIDEPRTWELSYLDDIRRELGLLDSTRPGVTVTMTYDTLAAVHRTGFPIITTDVYPFFFEGNPNGPNPAPVSRAYYRQETETFARACAQAGKTFWVMPGAFAEIWGDWYYDKDMNVVAQPGAYINWRMPTPGETRWQVWQGLAAGAKGVIFFVLFPPGNDRTAETSPSPPARDSFPRIAKATPTGQPAALLNIDSTPTAQMAAMGAAYADVERLAPVLQSLSRSNFPAVFAGGPLHCETFHDGKGNLYAIVVNDNTDQAVTGEITLLPGIERVRDLRAGRELPVAAPRKDSLQRATVSLEPGGGTLLQLAADPGRRPLATLTEDFSTPTLAGELQNARVVVEPRTYGAGWSHELAQTDEAKPGTLTCEVSTLTGDPKAHRPSGPIYIVYRGRQGAGSVELGFSADGESFANASVNEFETPIALTPQARHVRFTIRSGAALTGFCAIATEAGG